jgi:hypothetical protein
VFLGHSTCLHQHMCAVLQLFSWRIGGHASLCKCPVASLWWCIEDKACITVMACACTMIAKESGVPTLNISPTQNLIRRNLHKMPQVLVFFFCRAWHTLS